MPPVTDSDVAALRLYAQRLAGERFPSPLDVVRWLGAVQAQDYAAATWALGQRAEGATSVQIDELSDAGAIVRTHVLRPTWHFALPEDIGWLLALTGSRVRRGLVGRWGQLELDEDVVARAKAAIGA